MNNNIIKYIMIVMILSSMILSSCSNINTLPNINQNIAESTIDDSKMTSQEVVDEPVISLPYVKATDSDASIEDKYAKVIVGESKVEELLDAGYNLRFEQDGILYLLDIDNALASANYQYKVMLYYEEIKIADITYTNASDVQKSPKDCIITALKIYTADDSIDDIDILVDDISIATMKIDDAISVWDGYERDNTSVKQYKKTSGGDIAKWIATISAGGDDPDEITSYSMTYYMDGN